MKSNFASMFHWECNWRNSCGDGLLTFRLNSATGFCLEISILIKKSPGFLRIPEITDHPPEYRGTSSSLGCGSSQDCQYHLAQLELASSDLWRKEPQGRQGGSCTWSWLAVSTGSPGSPGSKRISQHMEFTQGAQ